MNYFRNKLFFGSYIKNYIVCSASARNDFGGNINVDPSQLPAGKSVLSRSLK